ncbi:MAG: sugar porter (SP) family MFS transporter [Psychrosphaera sp.]|jgi:sugar porter (SP) family MFS transporter
MKISPTIIYTIIVSLGGFIFGFDASVISGTLNFIVTEFDLTSIEQGFVVSAPTLGAIIATVTAGILADRFGRRNLLIVIALLYLLSAVASAFSTSYWMLVSARFIGGLAFCSLMIAPMYIAEISQPEKRGKLVSINQLNIVIGFSAAYFANYYVLELSQSSASWVSGIGLDTHTWRWMLGLEILPALAWFILLFYVPRSPRWLALKGQDTQAISVLKQLNESDEQHDYQQDIEQIKRSIENKDTSLLASLKYLFNSKIRFAITIGIIVGIAQQITGINAIFFYAPSIFEQSGVGTNAAFAQAVLVGVINVLFTIAAMMLIDKLGRKPLLTIGLAGVSLSMALCAYGFSQATYKLTADDIESLVVKEQSLAKLMDVQGKTYQSDVEFKQTIVKLVGQQTFSAHQGDILKLAATMNATVILLGILGFVASFAFSLGPVMWVMFSEIFPNHVRGIAISFVSVINSIVSFTVTFVFPWELEVLGSAITFLIYGAFAFIALILVVRLFPETKGKSLEQIEAEMAS